MALINPKCIGEPELCSRSDALTSDRQGINYSQLTELEKAKFQTPAISNAARNCVEHNSAVNVSQDLVHQTKSDTEASASFDFESEERGEIAEIPDVPAPTPALERVEEQSHIPGSRKSMRQNLGRPASSFSDFYM